MGLNYLKESYNHIQATEMVMSCDLVVIELDFMVFKQVNVMLLNQFYQPHVATSVECFGWLSNWWKPGFRHRDDLEEVQNPQQMMWIWVKTRSTPGEHPKNDYNSLYWDVHLPNFDGNWYLPMAMLLKDHSEKKVQGGTGLWSLGFLRSAHVSHPKNPKYEWNCILRVWQ